MSEPASDFMENPEALVATEKSEQNVAVVDPWTVVHFSMGLAAGLTRCPFGPSVGAAVLYEVAEQVIERTEKGKEIFKTKRPEVAMNAVVDVVVFAVGHWLGSRWDRS